MPNWHRAGAIKTASRGDKSVSKITIWGRKSSVNVQSVLWCLDELDLAYRRIDAGFTYGVVTTPDFLAMNPNGKVPVLIDADGPAIFEAGRHFTVSGNAICRWAILAGNPCGARGCG